MSLSIMLLLASSVFAQYTRKDLVTDTGTAGTLNHVNGIFGVIAPD